VSSKGLPDASVEGKELVTVLQSVCTPVCTNQADSGQPDHIGALAAALLGLPPADRARLAALLIGGQVGSGSAGQ
jgi:hypothetical protein